MPIYEFTCRSCGAENEILLRDTEWKKTPCPSCGARRLMKKLSVFAAGGSGARADAPACGTGQGPCSGCHCGAGSN